MPEIPLTGEEVHSLVGRHLSQGATLCAMWFDPTLIQHFRDHNTYEQECLIFEAVFQAITMATINNLNNSYTGKKLHNQIIHSNTTISRGIVLNVERTGAMDNLFDNTLTRVGHSLKLKMEWNG